MIFLNCRQGVRYRYTVGLPLFSDRENRQTRFFLWVSFYQLFFKTSSCKSSRSWSSTPTCSLCSTPSRGVPVVAGKGQSRFTKVNGLAYTWFWCYLRFFSWIYCIRSRNYFNITQCVTILWSSHAINIFF